MIKDLQTVIYSAIAAGFSDYPITVDIYDDVPEKAVMPYVKIGDITSAMEIDSMQRVTVSIELLSMYKGKKQLEEMHTRLIRALSNIKGFYDTQTYCVYLRHSSSFNQPDIDYRQATVNAEFLISY